MQINLELLKELSDSEKITLWNEYQNEISSESQIYENDEHFFNEYFSGDPNRAVRATHYGEYNYTDTYVSFDGYANIESFNDVDNQIDYDELADWLEENPDSYQDYDIWEEEEEEESEFENYSVNTYEEAFNFMNTKYSHSDKEYKMFESFGRSDEAIGYAHDLGFDIED